MILMGPPGAGKGTQAKLLEQHFRVPHVSSGDLLRTAVKRKTAMGLQAKRYMDRGDLVPDEILVGAIEDRLRDDDCHKGFILDGFPRTLPQSEALGNMLQGLGADVRDVVSIHVPKEDLVKRMSGRRVCRECGDMYHIIFNPPNNQGICNKCNGELYQRDDDQEDTIVARLDVYARQTAPLISLYRERGLLREIDGLGGQSSVFDRILSQVQS